MTTLAKVSFIALLVVIVVIIAIVLSFFYVNREYFLEEYFAQPTVTLKDSPDDVVILYERQEHGKDRTPAFEFTIAQDGEVTYMGKKYVKVSGTRRTTIPREEVESILRDARNIAFPLPNFPCHVGSILSNLSVRVDGQIHGATLCSFDDDDIASAPNLQQFLALAGKIMEASTVSQWVR